MNNELQQRFLERWPAWFNTKGDIGKTLMSSGFCHGDGWFDILWRLFEDLEPVVAGKHFQVLQLKEKCGGLRVYVSSTTDEIQRRIESAEQESFRTCEVCGQPGKRRQEHWIKTLCNEHVSAPGAREDA